MIAFVALGSSRAATAPPTADSHQIEWANVAAAVWLFISPWVLGMTYAMAWNAWIVAVVVFAVALGGATWSPPRTYATPRP